MKSYGSYETLAILSQGEGKSVFTARDKTSEGFAVKTFALAHYVGDNEDKAKEFDAFFYGSVEPQKKAALNSPYVAPVLQFGQDTDSAWYVTTYYPNSAQKLIASRVSLTRENFFKIIYGMVRGAIDIKKVSGRSHGNLQPSNVLFVGDGKNKVDQVVVSDPAAGEAGLSDKFEAADLHQIGEMMYRLVYPHETREIDLQKIPLLPTSQKWVSLFGNDAERWFEICNRLLQRSLPLDTYNLDQLEADLRKLKPQAKAVRSFAGALAIVLLIVIGVSFWSATHHKSTRQSVSAATNSSVDTNASAVAEKKRAEEVEARRLAEQKRAADEKRVAEEKRLAEQKAGEQRVAAAKAEQVRLKAEQEAKAIEQARLKAEADLKAREEARLKAEAEARQREQKRLAEERASAEARVREETRLKLEAAEKARLAAEQQRLAEEKKARELAAELERREKAAQEAARKAAEEARIAEAKRVEQERKAKELAAELERREREKQAAAQKAAEEEARRKQAEAKRLEEERKARELAAALAKERQQAEAQRNTATAGGATANAAAAIADAPEANTTKPAKGSPWINSLQMRFTPVGDGSVLFCVWETRRKDFEEFVRASRVNIDQAWKNTTFKQTALHPVVNVTAAEADAFCKWLTELEQRKGVLSAKQAYRLPTDKEWIDALRVGGGSTFLWGQTWPPPTGVGNFASNYSYDHFDFTGPAGQFKPNGAALHDLAGNAWEMCVAQRGGPAEFARGGSWLTASAEQLMLPYRLSISAGTRREDVGFRCVLDLAGK